jgi:hypothetical protein
VKKKSLILCIFLICSIDCYVALSVLAAETTLTDEDKRAKRLKYSEYFEEELAKAELALEQTQVKPWNINAETYIGFDNNPALNSKRAGDFFHENFLEVKANLNHEGIVPPFGPGQWGVAFESLFLVYFEAQNFDYHNMYLKPYLTSSLGGNARLELEYELSAKRYIRDNQLNYIGQAVAATIKDQLSDTIQHHVDVNYANKEYSDRAALTPTGVASAAAREDRYLDVGYGLDFILGEKDLIGVSAAWKFNDSNDQDRDFNDYKGWRVNSYYFHKLLPTVSLIFAGGFDFTQYGKRTFAPNNSFETERDNYFYVTSLTYIQISKSTQLVFSHLYNQNGSNDVGQEYSASTMKLGLVFSF